MPNQCRFNSDQYILSWNDLCILHSQTCNVCSFRFWLLSTLSTIQLHLFYPFIVQEKIIQIINHLTIVTCESFLPRLSLISFVERRSFSANWFGPNVFSTQSLFCVSHSMSMILCQVIKNHFEEEDKNNFNSILISKSYTKYILSFQMY